MRGIHRWLDCYVAKTSQPVASYTILNTDGHIWTNLFITAYNNTNMTVLRKYITSHWRYVRDTASQITGNSTVVFRLNKGDIKVQHYWPFVRGIHWYLILSSLFTIIIIIFNYHHNYHYFLLLLLSLLLLSLLCVFVIMIIIIIIIITIIIIIVVVLVVVISIIIIIIMSLLLSLLSL